MNSTNAENNNRPMGSAYSINKSNKPIWLAILGILPTLGVGIWVCRQLFTDLIGYLSVGDMSAWVWEQVLWPDINWVLSWIAPLLLSILVSWIILIVWKKPGGIYCGIVTIGLSYMYLIWKLEYDVNQCLKTQPMCGEWSTLANLLYFGLGVVNLLCLISVMFIIRNAQTKHDFNKQQSKLADKGK